MNFEEMMNEIRNNENVRATRVQWGNKYRWLCLANPAFKIPTKDIWNKHTKEQSKQFNGEMNLLEYFIYCENNNISYGLESLREADYSAKDWKLI